MSANRSHAFPEPWDINLPTANAGVSDEASVAKDGIVITIDVIWLLAGSLSLRSATSPLEQTNFTAPGDHYSTGLPAIGSNSSFPRSANSGKGVDPAC